MMFQLHHGDSLAVLQRMASDSVHCCVTSPPYYALRTYGVDGEMGLEKSPEEYLDKMVQVFAEVRRVLRPDGVCWVNIGDSYATSGGPAGQKNKGNNGSLTAVKRPRHNNLNSSIASVRGGGHKASALQIERFDKVATDAKALDRLGIPEQLALRLRADGWHWRATVIWWKLAPMPASLEGTRWEKCRKKVANGEVSRRGPAGSHDKIVTTDHKNAPALATREDCPGCPKCTPNGGLVLRQGSWRPTPAWEPILMLTKTSRYFADQEAVRTSPAEATQERDRYTRKLDDPDEQFAVKHNHETLCIAGANPRDVQVFASSPQGSFMISEDVFFSSDDAPDDSQRITSEDCPIHGSRQVSTVSRDEPQGEKSCRTERKQSCPSQEPQVEHAPTRGQFCQESVPDPACVPAAKARSKRKNKKLHESPTNESNNASLETPCRTGRTGVEHGASGPCPDKQESKTEVGSAANAQPIDLSEDTVFHTPNKSPCTCSFKKVIVSEASHLQHFHRRCRCGASGRVVRPRGVA